MRLEYYPQEKLKKEILAIIGKYLDLREYKVFVFGSRVKGEKDDRGDIDIGIIGKQTVPSMALENIQEELENLPLLYTIEVVDFSQVTPEFRDIALRDIELLHQ